MQLSKAEFDGMNHPVRRLFQEHLEWRVFRWLGLEIEGLDVLEIGCGNGFGATLLALHSPSTYHGVDLMPEQITLASRLDLPGARFEVMDATNLSGVPSNSKDVVVIFGILHHIPGYLEALAEVRRVLRTCGLFFFEEPDRLFVDVWDRAFQWGHHPDAGFRLPELTAKGEAMGFEIERRLELPRVLGSYRARKVIPGSERLVGW